MENDKEVEFFDCCSEGELSAVPLSECILKTGSGDSECRILNKRLLSLNNPLEIRDVLERAANNAQILLRGLGGQMNYTVEDLEVQRSCKRFYPATLEISARLHTDMSCSCPPHCQCVLRNDPVTVNLPIELNPDNGQVKVNIFQPNPRTLGVAGSGLGAGDRLSCTCGPNAIKKHSQRRAEARKSGRRVRWPEEA